MSKLGRKPRGEQAATKVLFTRVTDDEKSLVKRASGILKVSESEFVREAAIARAMQVVQVPNCFREVDE